jgi:hypothetical protein
MSIHKQNWGIYDTVDKCWIGDEMGPKLFVDTISPNGKIIEAEMLAMIAAQMVDMQLGNVARCRAKVFNEKEVHLKDEKKTRFGAEEALKHLEDGRLV